MEEILFRIRKKPQYKIMHVVFNQCLRLNFSKALFTVFLFTIIETLSCLVPFSLAILSSSPQGAGATGGVNPSISRSLLSFVLTLAFCIVIFMMLYGMFCVTARMVQKKSVTVGWLFIAFRKKDSRVLRSSLVFTAIYVLLGLAASLIFFFFLKENSSSYIWFFMVAALVFLLAFIPFSFVHLIIYYFKNVKTLSAFALSMRLLRGQFFHFLGFILYAAGTSLISLVLLSIVLALFPKNPGTPIGIFTMFLSIMRLFEYYKVLARVFIALPLYFFFTIGAIQVYQSDYSPANEGGEEKE